MKLVEMKLREEPLLQIKNGEKTVELRLYDEKRRTVEIGDEISFSKYENANDKILVRVMGLYREKSFLSLFASKKILSDSGFFDCSAEEAASLMRKYYSEEDEMKYGVLAIEFSLVK